MVTAISEACLDADVRAFKEQEMSNVIWAMATLGVQFLCVSDRHSAWGWHKCADDARHRSDLGIGMGASENIVATRPRLLASTSCAGLSHLTTNVQRSRAAHYSMLRLCSRAPCLPQGTRTPSCWTASATRRCGAARTASWRRRCPTSSGAAQRWSTSRRRPWRWAVVGFARGSRPG